MPLTIDPFAQAGEGETFTYYGRILKFREEDSSPEHKERIGAAPETYVGQFVIDIEGVSVEWVGENGNCITRTADLYKPDGKPKTGRRSKWFPIWAALAAPESEEEAGRIRDPETGVHIFRRRVGGKDIITTGLGLDHRADDFPECTEGHVYKIEHRRLEFGKDAAGEPISTQVPILLSCEDGYIHEGTPTPISYGRPSAEVEGSTPDSPIVANEPASPIAFFTAIDGLRNERHVLYEAISADDAPPGLTEEPYRTVVLIEAKRQKLADAGLITLEGEDIHVNWDNVPGTVEELKELLS